MSKRSHKAKGDVRWHTPGRKTPIAYSTKATSDLIVALSQDGATIQEVRDRIIYDVETRRVLDIYVAKGYGNTIARTFFK